MSGVLIHDGRRAGQRLWSVDAVRSHAADGVILNPFATPRVTAPRNPNAQTVAADVRAVGGEVLFDVSTHAFALSTTDKLDFYNQWELWGKNGAGLDTDQRRLEHVERSFSVQDTLGTARLAPTLQLTSPTSEDSRHAAATALLAAGLDPAAGQTLVGTRTFWASGASLDAFIGELAALRAPVWVLTVANELVVSAEPDLADTAAFMGLCRTVHSLSLRSRVIVSHADFTGLPAVAAGADTVGSGWDRAQRTFDPLAFHVSSDDSPRIPASYVTQGGLHAVLRRSVAEAIERWDSKKATTLRGGPMPPSDAAERLHHLTQLRGVVLDLAARRDRSDRVTTLRDRYSMATTAFDQLLSEIPGVLTRADKKVWATNQAQILDGYASEEGLLTTP